jgi:branched-chain amino acid transport system permease protein
MTPELLVDAPSPQRAEQHEYAFQARDRKAWLTLTAICVLAIAVPFMAGTFGIYLGCVVACYSIATLGLQLMVGVAGQLSLGHAAFVAIGSYVTVLAQMRLGLGFFPAAALGVLASALSGLLMAQLIRLSGVYFKIATFGFGVIVYQIISNWSSLTGGQTGITRIPPIKVAGWSVTTRTELFMVIVTVLVIAYVLTLRMVQGRAGRALLAIGQNEPAAEAIGVNVAGYKMAVIVFGCALGGLGGAFLPQLTGFLSPDSFTWGESLLLLIMITVGGLGSLPGAVVGTAVLIVVPEYLRDFAEYKMLLFGVLLVVALIFMPRGLAGVGQQLLRILQRARPHTEQSR